MKTFVPVCLVSALITLTACGDSDDNLYFPLPVGVQDVIYSEDQSFSVDTVLADLKRPWDMEFLPDNRVLVSERSGKLLMIKNGQLQSPVIKIIEDGLRGITLHPKFKDNGWIYLSYYKDPEGMNKEYYSILTRAKLDGDNLIGETIIYTAGPFQESPEWFGSRIAFDRDGFLYFAVGQRDGIDNPQKLTHHSGKTMRLNDDGTIPPDNPFIDSAYALPEIFTYGHRQHQGLILNPETGELWSNEHGAKGGDELNIIESGVNFGWPLATYSLNYDDSIISPDTLLEGTKPPVHHWTPSIAPSGMAFITGNRYPGWKGDLFTGSLKFRMLNRSKMENNQVVGDEELLKNIGRVRTVTHAPDDYLYILTEDSGLLVRLLPVNDKITNRLSIFNISIICMTGC